MKKQTYIIAEAGVNHNGSLEVAMKLISEAKRVGADAIKFQTFKADELILKETEKAAYQRNDVRETQFSMLKRLELSHDDFKKLKEFSLNQNIDFLSSAFDMESLEFLISLNLPKYKLPSGEIITKPFLQKLGKLNKPLILSTGMSTIKEITLSIEILYKSGLDKKNLTLLHCNTDYPTAFSDVHLNAMQNLKDIFGVPVGYSDHTTGNEISIGAVALGASIIEKHFTLDNSQEGPDHSSSLEPKQFEELVRAIRNTEIALGQYEKKPSDNELKNLFYVRKSIVSSVEIKKGEIFSEQNITCKRPAGGISPMKWDDVLGKKAKRNYHAGEYIEF